MNTQSETEIEVPEKAPAAEGEPQFELRGFDTEAGAGETEITAEQADQIMAGATGGETPQAETPKKEPKVKIGDRSFETAEEAWTYAQELEREKLAADAFRHGIETATQGQLGNPSPAAQKQEEPTEIDPLFYTNPQAYHKKLKEELEQKVISRVDQIAEGRKRNDETWKQFYADYPDLTNAGELVQLTLTQNWDRLKFVDTKIALKEVATKAREMKRRIVADMLPGQELPQVKRVASPGHTGEVTQKEPEAKTLNFVQQFRNLNKKRTARPMRR